MILPSSLDHPGIAHKVASQIHAFKRKFSTSFIYFNYRQNGSRFNLFIDYLRFNITCCARIIVTDRVYARYNAKFPMIHFISALASIFKPIDLEMNIHYSTELKFLNRPIELFFHRVTIGCLRFFPVRFVCMTPEISTGLGNMNVAVSRRIVIQNGCAPFAEASVSHTASSLTYEVVRFKKDYEKIAVFIGQNFPWHGLDRIIDIFTSYSQIGVVIIGPIPDIDPPKNIRFLGPVAHSALPSLLGLFDFAIGTFAWERIGIHEGCPLKTRDYLISGLPVLVNYIESASSIPELSPYIVHYGDRPDAIHHIANLSYHSVDISKYAQTLLSWDNVLAPLWLTKS